MAEVKDGEDFPTIDLDLELEPVITGEEGAPETEGAAKPDPDTPEGPTFTEQEQVAFEQGWRPKEDFVAAGGDPKKWRPADWWLDRGELLGRQQELSRDLKQVKEAFVKLAHANQTSYIKGRVDAIRQLKAERKEALKESNLEAVVELEDKIEAVETELNTAQRREEQERAQAAAAQPSPEYVNWLEGNKWYLSDETLHNYANAVAKKFVDYNPNSSQADALRFISENVRQEFPHKFAGVPRVAQPNVSGRGRQDGGNKSDNKGGGNVDAQFTKIVSTMDPDTRRVVVDLVRTGELTKAEYVKSYKG